MVDGVLQDGQDVDQPELRVRLSRSGEVTINRHNKPRGSTRESKVVHANHTANPVVGVISMHCDCESGHVSNNPASGGRAREAGLLLGI